MVLGYHACVPAVPSFMGKSVIARAKGTVTRVDTEPLQLVYEPITIGNVVVPNRVVRTAHLTRFSTGIVSDDLIAYHVARARGGVGLTILEATAVDPQSVLAMIAFDDAATAGYARLMDAVEPHGMRVFVQLWHGGHHYSQPGGRPPRGVSRVPSLVNPWPPVPLSSGELADLVQSFANAARRVIDGGIDGIEVHAGHGYLIHQFLSTLTNTRHDEYGGSLENRMRFLVEVLTAIRSAVGDGPPIGVRVSAGQIVGDLSEDIVADVVRRLVQMGLIDFVNASMGDYYGVHWVTGDMERVAGYQLASSGQITAATREVPRIVTGRFRDLADVEDVLRSGQADMVSMVRAHIADPEIVRKTREGRATEIRPCIGCNQGCLARASGVDLRLGCAVNPAIGQERSMSEESIGTTSSPRRVIVVGGGPAGMEAARAARLRGHDVVLFEAQAELGGAINIARRAPGASGFGDIVDWLGAELRRLDVDVRLRTPADSATIASEAADVLIIATGAEYDRSGAMVATPGEPVTGVDQAHVRTPTEALTCDPTALGLTCLVYDDVGHYESVAVVEHLLNQGIDVIAATRLPAFAPIADASARLQPALDRFMTAPGKLISLHVRTHLRSIAPAAACLRLPGQSADVSVSVDSVVLVTFKIGGDVSTLVGSRPSAEVHVIGDASSGRDLQTAIREGYVTGRGIQ
jgi:2,4-dienoyl-CoA reductase-like NADH-dependent reductase (Old Yellow Enzyme family)